ncbi:hypothetical protein [Streptomyces harbinensis]|uniref:hypothetical protein n=1 Tax=Streptomyces harbinensis TaxID=1176198 RepID=UPI0036876835
MTSEQQGEARRRTNHDLLWDLAARHTHRVRLGSSDTIHSLTIDGVDVSRGTSAATLTLAPGALPSLTVDPIVHAIEDSQLGEVQVHIPPATAALLRVLGWTPPPTTTPTPGPADGSSTDGDSAGDEQPAG